MIQYHYRPGSGRAVFFRTKRTPQLRVHAQHIKIISR